MARAEVASAEVAAEQTVPSFGFSALAFPYFPYLLGLFVYHTIGELLEEVAGVGA